MLPYRNRLLRDRHDARARAFFNLVAPLGAAAAAASTDMRTTDTAPQLDLFGQAAEAGSGAVSGLIGLPLFDAALRPGDVDSANDRRTRTTPATPGTRTSPGATRTTGTRATRTALVPSADRNGTGFSYRSLVDAWLDTRRTKRNTDSARGFEAALEANLDNLHERLAGGTYQPGRAHCFVVLHPRPREIWAAPFADRIPHHLLHHEVGPRFERAFIADSCACIEGRGTLYAARRLEAKIRSASRNWSRRVYYLKCDLANFFVSIDKHILAGQLERRIREPFWRDLAGRILFHDPRADVDVRGDPARLALIPRHKSLFNQDADHGLPIGNLSSQFFANVYLDALDQFVKHRLRARHYIRYVDDFVLLHESPKQLNTWRAAIEAFLPRRLGVQLNYSKTILQPVSRGVDFVGQVIKPWRRTIRRRTYNAALSRLEAMPAEDLHQAANSYLGLARQASHSHRDRARIANLVRRRGLAVDHQLTKVYP